MHTREQFLKLTVGLVLYRFSLDLGWHFVCFFLFVLVLFVFVVLDLVSSILSQEIV